MAHRHTVAATEAGIIPPGDMEWELKGQVTATRSRCRGRVRDIPEYEDIQVDTAMNTLIEVEAAVSQFSANVVTDPRRFSDPLTMEQALERARIWWDSKDVDRVLPDEGTVAWFLTVMSQHQLGRKRVLDTLLAGTLRAAGISSVLTLNPSDFTVFAEFTCVSLDAN